MTVLVDWQRRAPLAFPLLFFCLGIALSDALFCVNLGERATSSWLNHQQIVLLLGEGMVAPVLMLFLLGRRKRLPASPGQVRINNWCFFVSMALAFILFGGLRRVMHEPPTAPVTQEVFVQGRAVAMDCRQTAKGTQVGIILTGLWADGKVLPRHDRVMAWFPAHDTLCPGTVLSLSGWLTPLASVATDEHADIGYVRHLMRRGYGARLWGRCLVVDGSAAAQDDLAALSAWERLQIRSAQTQTALAERYAALPCTPRSHTVLAALTLGERSHLTSDTRQIYSQAGAAHILALSGLHLGLLLGCVALIFRRLCRYLWGQVVYGITALGLIWGLVLLTGMPVSLVRAAVMGSLWIVLDVCGRESNSLNNLMLTGLVLLMLDVQALFDTGFQLSFLSVAAILLLTGWQARQRMMRQILAEGQTEDEPRRRFRFVWTFAAISCAAQVATAPIVAHQFGSLPLYFLLGNALAIPAAWLLLTGGMLFFVLDLIPAIGTVLSDGVGWLIAMTGDALTAILSAIGSLPGATIVWQPAVLQITLYYAILTLTVVALRHRALCHTPRK